uniref:Putative signal transduction protein with CBS domains n=1 Tax=Nitratidesulfovibrio vulgaris (strain DSM 19637 / Miyazaki F) TaxID=883 RepID=B8DPI7_NITV9
MHEDVIRFLRGVPPFQFLPRARLRTLAFGTQVAFIPAGEALESTTEDGMPVLHVVVKGTIAVEGASAGLDGAAQGGEALGPGAVLGWPFGRVGAVPVAGHAEIRDRLAAWAATDALCYMLPVRTVADALDDRPDLCELLAPGFGPALLDLGVSAMARRSGLTGQGGRPWQTVTAGEAMPAGFAAAPVHVSLHEAARLMTARQRSAIVLLDGDGRAAGILTDRDFRSRVVGGGADHALPASVLMSAPVAGVQAGTPCLDVMLLMAGRNIHHVVVVEGDEPVGVLSSHDLMVLRGVSPTALAERIGAAGTLTELVETAPRADALAAVLLAEGARAATLSVTLPDLHDRMTARLFELGMAALGAPPRPWCFMAFGRAARREAWFRHRQWNGLVVGDAPDTHAPDTHGVEGRDAAPGGAGLEEHVAAYFGTLARFVRDGLRALGFAPCPQGRMVATPGWTLTVAGWRDRFLRLAGAECGGTQTAGAADMPLPARLGMFDVRPVCGDAALGLRVAAVADAVLADAVQAGAHWPLAAGQAGQTGRAGQTGQIGQAGQGGQGGTPRAELLARVHVMAAGQGVQPPATLARLDALAAALAACEGTTEKMHAEVLHDARRACEYLLLRAAHAELARHGMGDGANESCEDESSEDEGDGVPMAGDFAAPAQAAGPGTPAGLDGLALRRVREMLRALDGLPGPCKAAQPPRREDGANAVAAGHAPVAPVAPVAPSRQGGRP